VGCAADPEGNEFCVERSDVERPAGVEPLGRAFAAVGDLITKVRPEQWSAPTPCTDWTVRQLVDHLIGMNRVFAGLLADEPPHVAGPLTTSKTTLQVHGDDQLRDSWKLDVPNR
jgi:uncharacterized protein (TIGR03083 family)